MAKQKGRVKWFNTSKGFGFIMDEDNTDVFVHYTDIVSDGFKNLYENQTVEFDLENSHKGKRAKNVILIN